MAKKKTTEEKTMGMRTVSFAAPFIRKCFNEFNEKAQQDIHFSITLFLEDIEKGLSHKDSNIYGVAYIAVQVIGLDITLNTFDMIYEQFENSPFAEIVMMLRGHEESFLEMVSEFSIHDLVAMLVSASFTVSRDDGAFRRSSILAHVAFDALVNYDDPTTVYADFGAGYGDFSIALASDFVPCQASFVCEKDWNAVMVAAARLCMISYNTAYDLGDIFATDWNRKFDRIFCEPSFNNEIDEISNDYIKAVKERYGVDVSLNDSDWLFALNAGEHLSDNGKALVVIRQKTLDDPKSVNGRKILLQQNLLAGIVNLPDEITNTNGEKLALALLRPGCKEVRLHDVSDFVNEDSKACNDVNTRIAELLRTL